jgi:hypothetical protein
MLYRLQSMEHSSFYPELLIELYVKLYTTDIYIYIWKTVWLNVCTSKVNRLSLLLLLAQYSS